MIEAFPNSLLHSPTHFHNLNSSPNTAINLHSSRYWLDAIFDYEEATKWSRPTKMSSYLESHQLVQHKQNSPPKKKKCYVYHVLREKNLKATVFHYIYLPQAIPFKIRPVYIYKYLYYWTDSIMKKNERKNQRKEDEAN